MLLLAECVPMHEGTEDEKAALREMVPLIPEVGRTCRSGSRGDVSLQRWFESTEVYTCNTNVR